MRQLLQTFTSPIICEISNNGKRFTLERGFFYFRKGESKPQADFKGYFEVPSGAIVVPKGFTSDGFTNFGFDFIVPRFGKGLKCAILHDFLCVSFHKGQNTRKFADEVFLEAMLETKAFSKAKAYLLYFAVRIFANIKGYK